MANKRMFSTQIVGSDSFTEMGTSAQALYFHLGMRADDDGFINNPKQILRMVGANEDDLKLLIAKRFLLAFENGVVVVKHWRIHNTLRKDRYTPTAYQRELSTLSVKDNGSYTDVGCQTVASWLPSGCQVVAKWLPQDSIDKDRLDKDSIDEDRQHDELIVHASNSLSYLNPTAIEQLVSFRDALPDECIRHGIDAACAAGKRSWSYCRAILNAYVEKGFKSVGDIEAHEAERKRERERPQSAKGYQQHAYTESDMDAFFFDPTKGG